MHTQERRRPSKGTWLVIGLVLVLAAFVFYPMFLNPKEGSHRSAFANIKICALSIATYSADNDDRLPLADSWMDALQPFAGHYGIFEDLDLSQRAKDEYGTAFFQPLSGVDSSTVVTPAEAPIVFCSKDVRRNANGDLSIRALRPNGEGSPVAFLDSHVKYLRKDWPRGPVVIVLDPSLKVPPK